MDDSDYVKENAKGEEYSCFSDQKDTLQDNLVRAEPIMVSTSYRNTGIRWFALCVACMLMVGNYMSYDFPTFLQNQIGQSVYDCEKFSDDSPQCKKYNNMYGWLYSIYSLPNCILPLFGGYFIDKIGIRKGLIIFTAILTIGQLICSFAGLFSGGWDKSSTVFVWFYIGRFIFALGGENQTVTQSTIVSKWFSGKELAFALGTNITFARLGSVAGGYLFPAIYKAHAPNLTWPLMVAEVFCIVSFCFMLVMVFLDRKADKQEGREEGQLDETEQVNLKDIGKFPLLYWLLSVSCLLNYLGIFIFIQFGNDFLQYKYQDTEASAGHLLTMPYFIAAGLTPFIGILADKIGNRQYLLLASSTLMLLAHLLFLILPDCPLPEAKCSEAWQLIPLILLGLFYACYAAVLWPCIPLVLEPNVVGTGFGVSTSIQNFGLFIAPQLVGYIIKSTKSHGGGYIWSEIFFTSVGIICVLLSLAIIVVNQKTGNKLGRITGEEEENDPKKSKAKSKASMHF